MIHSKYQVVLGAVLALAIVFGLGLAWKSHKPAKRPVHAAGETANWEMTNAWASSDSSRIALSLRRKRANPSPVEGDYDNSVAIFDPVAKKVLSNVKWDVADSAFGPHPKWSYNSQWLALPDANSGQDVLLVNRDGKRKRILHLGRTSSVRSFVWLESQPRTLAYVLDHDRSVHEYDLDTDTDRSIFHSSDSRSMPQGLFNVKGRLCAAFLSITGDRNASRGRVFVIDVASRRQVLDIPLSYADFDGMDFDMSTDGANYAIWFGDSLNVNMVVGNTQDAASTFTRPWRALFLDGGVDISPKPRLAWYPGEPDADPQSRVAIVDSTQGYLVLNGSGGWSLLQLIPPRPATFAWWKDGLYLAIDKDGLWITNNGRTPVPKGSGLRPLDPYKEELILRHRELNASGS